ncbi:hypothetical protein GCM10027167_60860 [Nocardia heshunensis]
MLRLTKVKFRCRKYLDTRFATRHDCDARHNFGIQFISSKPTITADQHASHESQQTRATTRFADPRRRAPNSRGPAPPGVSRCVAAIYPIVNDAPSTGPGASNRLVAGMPYT